MAEECKDPVRIFPKVMLTGLVITGTIYVLVSITAVALVPLDRLGEGDTPLLQVVEAGAPGFPGPVRVHRHVRGGELGADQHADGQPAALRHEPGKGAA